MKLGGYKRLYSSYQLFKNIYIDKFELDELKIMQEKWNYKIAYDPIVLVLDGMKMVEFGDYFIIIVYRIWLEVVNFEGCFLPWTHYDYVMSCYCYLNAVDYGFALLAAVVNGGYRQDGITYAPLVAYQCLRSWFRRRKSL